MSILTNSHRRSKIVVILALMISLILPISVIMNPSLDTNSNYNPSDFVSLAAVPSLNITYHTLSDTTERPVTSDSFIAGDHVTITAVWNEFPVDRSRLEIIAPAIPAVLTQELDTNVVTIDTRYLGNNATCFINASSWLTNGTMFSKTFQNVHIGNFFIPFISLIAPNGNEIWTGINNITWTASDNNEAYQLRYYQMMEQLS